MNSLMGNFKVALDPKGRLAIPVRLRHAFPGDQQDRIVLTRGLDHCITGYCEERWQNFKQKIDKMKLSYKEKSALKREFIGRAVEAPFDKQGRVTLTADLLEWAQLNGLSEVIVMGCDAHIEIWNAEVYGADREATEQMVQKVMGENYFD